MSTNNNDKSASVNFFKLTGYYNINDIKYDLLKIIAPYDGYMYNEKETEKLLSVFGSYLGDLKRSFKIFSFEIEHTEKENAITHRTKNDTPSQFNSSGKEGIKDLINVGDCKNIAKTPAGVAQNKAFAL
jgi:hypothetical protein